MSKPREFWLSLNHYDSSEDVVFDEFPNGIRSVHVIEKSAYDTERLERINAQGHVFYWKDKYDKAVEALKNTISDESVLVEHIWCRDMIYATLKELGELLPTEPSNDNTSDESSD